MLPSGLLFVLFVLGATLTREPSQSPSSDLAPGDGRDLVLAACTGCHTTELIVASHMSRKTWDTTLTWMEETQSMARLEPDVRKAIVDYLERTQGLSAEEESGTSSPWAYPRYRPNPPW
jgi:mono/diheme cytochrome c family protein